MSVVQSEGIMRPKVQQRSASQRSIPNRAAPPATSSGDAKRPIPPKTFNGNGHPSNHSRPAPRSISAATQVGRSPNLNGANGHPGSAPGINGKPNIKPTNGPPTNGYASKGNGHARTSDASSNDSRNGDSRTGFTPASRIAGDRITPDAKLAPAKPSKAAKPEPKILFQRFFKSVGPRTYAAQVKECANGNHLLVLTEGKRDPETQEVRKTRVFVYGEDFTALFRLLHETAAFIRANPVPEEVRQRRDRFWARKGRDQGKNNHSGTDAIDD